MVGSNLGCASNFRNGSHCGFGLARGSIMGMGRKGAVVSDGAPPNRLTKERAQL